MNQLGVIQDLIKALEAGSYNAAPGTLTQGAALQVEDLSPVMHNVTYDDSHIKLQRTLKVKSCKAITVQFNRQLSYGTFGGSAQIEGHIGQEETSDFYRITVPMCFYSEVRRVTMVADMVETVDGMKGSERMASDAAKRIAGDVEFDLFRGLADFSNGGVFDGHPSAHANLPNIHGLDLQIRQSDSQTTAQDMMFSEYGSDESVIIQGGAALTQANIEDAHVRSEMNMGHAEKLLLDPKVLSAYNKITFGMQRIVLSGSPQEATGADLRRQWTSGAPVNLEASRFLSGKTSPQRSRTNGPSAPAGLAVASTTVAGTTTAFAINERYTYFATTGNEVGESPRTATVSVTVAASGDVLRATITHPVAGVARYFNMYRTEAGGTKARYIGRVVIASGAGTTTFDDLGNRVPGFVTGFLIQDDTMDVPELSPYARLKLAITDLSTPECHFRFLTLRVTEPRKNVLIDNLRGAIFGS